jgi:hypothetical protein
LQCSFEEEDWEKLEGFNSSGDKIINYYIYPHTSNLKYKPPEMK